MQRSMVRVAAFLVFAVAGCATSGVKVSDEQVAALTVGQTTYQQAISALGRPTSEARSSAAHLVAYTYATARTRPATFVPVVGLFAGGADTESRTVMLRFDSADLLQDVTTSTSAIGSGLGVAPAGMETAGTDQPRTAR